MCDEKQQKLWLFCRGRRASSRDNRNNSESSAGIEMMNSILERKQKEREEYEKKLEDPIIGILGEYGNYQLLVLFAVTLIKFAEGWQEMAGIFLSPPIEISCIEPAGTDNACSDNCTKIHYNTTIFTNTINMEWNLICGMEYLGHFAQTIVMFGILVGNFAFGILADKYGRKKPFLIALVLELISGILVAFSPYLWVFFVFRFLNSVGVGGLMIISFVLIMEVTGNKWRELISILYQIPFNLGHMTLPIFSYFLRDWREFAIAIGVVSHIAIVDFFILDESPRYLYTQKRFSDAEKILIKGAKYNGRNSTKINQILQDSHNLKFNEETVQTKGSVIDLFKSKIWAVRTTIMFLNWFSCGITFFGVALYAGTVHGNIFLNVVISATFALPGAFLYYVMAKYIGRKYTLVISQCTSGISMLIVAFASSTASRIVITFSSIGICAMTVAFPVVYLYSTELFPTVVRNSAIGTASVTSKVASMIAPFVAGLSTSKSWLVPLLFSITPLIAGLLALLLPETKGKKLPDNLNER